MLPLVAKGQSIGLVELFSKTVDRAGTTSGSALARTMANEAAMALENARLYEDARKLADRDPLTGFYNHRFLHERLGEEVVRAQRARRPLSVLMLDLDDFKLVNDTFGHLFGDRVLTWTAELIRSTLRGSDIPARYGGDEFAIILPETDADDARAAAERILDAFRDRAVRRASSADRSRSARPSASPRSRPTAAPATDLIAAADAALYRVKRDGGHDAARPRRPPPPDRSRAVPRTKVPADRDPPVPRTRVDERPFESHPRFRRDPTHRRPHPPRGPAGSTDPPGVGSSSPAPSSLLGAIVVLSPRSPAAPSPSTGSSSPSSASSGSRRIRHRQAVLALEIRPPRRGRVVRPDPVRPVAVGLAGRHRRAPSSRSSARRPAPITSSSSAAAPTRGSSRRR